MNTKEKRALIGGAVIGAAAILFVIIAVLGYEAPDRKIAAILNPDGKPIPCYHVSDCPRSNLIPSNVDCFRPSVSPTTPSGFCVSIGGA